MFLNGQYAKHLGDNCSRLADKRLDDTKTPYDFIPKELLVNRKAPYINYKEMDWIYDYPADVTLVTLLLDISRNDRNFEEHYLKSLEKILSVRNPLIVYADPKYHEYIKLKRKELSIATSNNLIEVREITLEKLEKQSYFNVIQKIISNPDWVNQSDWIKNSALVNPYYIPLTLIKNSLLEEVAEDNPLHSKRFYWIDAGIFNSFHITEPITSFNFLKIQPNNFLLTSFSYFTNSEIHGLDINYMESVIGKKPYYVCRATLFGGSKDQIKKFNEKYFKILDKTIEDGKIGTEEAIFTIVEMMYPELVNRCEILNGDIKNFLSKLK